MFRGLFFSDLHYTEQPPIMRKDGYGEHILCKLSEILNFAQGDDREVFFCGDLFHRKSGVSNRELNKIIGELVRFDPMHIILGNHDIQGHNPDLDTRGIGVLINSGVVKMIGDDDYIECQGGQGVFVTGHNYHAHYEEEEPWSFNFKRDDCNLHIRLLHAMVSNQNLPFDCMNIKNIAGEISADLIFNGHYHVPWEDPEVGFYNLGSIARIAMDKNMLNHNPSVITVDYEAGKQPVVNREVLGMVREDVWISEIKRETIDSDEVEKFAKSIEEMDINDDEDLLKEILKDEDPEVEKLVYQYLGE